MEGGDGGGPDLVHLLYIAPSLDYYDEENKKRDLSIKQLEDAVKALHPISHWKVIKTGYGLIAAFSLDCDASALLNESIMAILGCPVHVARFSSKDTRFMQTVMIHEVPWAVPIEEIKDSLVKQGINPVSLTRIRGNVRVELNDPMEYESLLRNGMNFFGMARFTVSQERFRSVVASRSSTTSVGGNEGVLQCYRCQGFWHIAADCQQMPRCVRCGEGHSVDMCMRPRHDPVCCHCFGPHHAAYRQCPVRLQLFNSVSATSISLSSVPKPLQSSEH